MPSSLGHLNTRSADTTKSCPGSNKHFAHKNLSVGQALDPRNNKFTHLHERLALAAEDALTTLRVRRRQSARAQNPAVVTRGRLRGQEVGPGTGSGVVDEDRHVHEACRRPVSATRVHLPRKPTSTIGLRNMLTVHVSFLWKIRAASGAAVALARQYTQQSERPRKLCSPKQTPFQ